MSIKKFKCTLLSDVILNVKSATEGTNKTLDFIPGSNFLGVAAASLYNCLSPEESLKVFHSGSIRFGDAHPIINGIRTLKVPASYFFPKGSTGKGRPYLHHFYNRKNDTSNNGYPMQLKQCRSGFYAFSSGIGLKVTPETSYAIKSAYDSNKRKSLDTSMFGYESLDKGLVLGFEIDFGDTSEELQKSIINSLIGKRHIGRSKTAQYGLVYIELADYEETISNENSGQITTVYADSRLIFMDENSSPIPTFSPTASQLGLNGDIIWDLSQIRTFSYAPWNGKRKYYDSDRCGIEKGSVFVVKCSKSPNSSAYIGMYNNEGFGKVIYNPDFLNQASFATNGEAAYELKSHNKTYIKENANEISTPLTDFLLRQKDIEENENTIYEMVNDFISRNGSKFKADTFASQWGRIRELATIYPDSCNEKIIDYISRGVAKTKWDRLNRRQLLIDFMGRIDNTLLSLAIINLSSEMAKLK